MSIEAMAEAATKALTRHVNRSVGQHLRAIRTKSGLDKLVLVYQVCSHLCDLGASEATTDAYAMRLCAAMDVDFEALQRSMA